MAPSFFLPRSASTNSSSWQAGGSACPCPGCTCGSWAGTSPCTPCRGTAPPCTCASPTSSTGCTPSTCSAPHPSLGCVDPSTDRNSSDFYISGSPPDPSRPVPQNKRWNICGNKDQFSNYLLWESRMHISWLCGILLEGTRRGTIHCCKMRYWEIIVQGWG